MFYFVVYIMADSSSESKPVMEEDTWKILVPIGIGPDRNCMDAKLILLLQEHYALKQAISIFPRPHHPPYNNLITRARSIEHSD
jgi:hypothetical protein